MSWERRMCALYIGDANSVKCELIADSDGYSLG
jgi:hypothetical protein